MGLLCRDFINEYRQWPQRNLQTGYSLAKKVDSPLYLETLNCYGTRDWRKDMSEPIGVGLIGLGTVGSGVVELLQDAPASMRRRKHVDFALRRIAVREMAKSRAVAVDQALLTAAASDVVADPNVQLVVELTGAAPAFEWVSAALKQGKDVVTANKAMLAECGEELFELALAHGADLMFEASVAGGIPIIRSLRSGLVANRVESLYGIQIGRAHV